jgi:hypothetical protein
MNKKKLINMKGLELLEKHPLAANIVRDWFMNQMLESFKDETVPEGFKQYMLEQGIDNDKVGTLIDVNPRNLLDVFDENNIIIETSLYPNGEFTIKIGNEATTNSWKTRKEAELFAIEAAFEILEKQLTPEEKTDEND